VTFFAAANLKSVLSTIGGHTTEFVGASRGFALCAVRGRVDSSQYTQNHAQESNQILDLLDSIKRKIAASTAVWVDTTLPNAVTALNNGKTALAAAEGVRDIAAAALLTVQSDMASATGKNDKELEMIEKIQSMVHNLNGRGADTCVGLPDGLTTTRDDGTSMWCKGGMIRWVLKCVLFTQKP